MIKATFKKRTVVYFLVLTLFAMWPTLLRYVFPNYPSNLIPTTLDQVYGYLAIIILSKVRSPILIFSGGIWMAWYLVGTLNVIASSQFYGDYYSSLDIVRAAQIYLGGSVAFMIGLYVYERIYSRHFRAASGVGHSMTPLGPVGRSTILIFPIAWIVSLYVTLGYIPVLSGLDITADIYQTDYGYLYPYTIILVLSALYGLYLHLNKRTTNKIWLYYAILSILLSVASGKRFTLIVFMLSSIPMLYYFHREKVWRYYFYATTAIAALYIVILFARQGWSQDIYLVSGATRFIFVGVEFRDFVYTVNNYAPGTIPGYAWFTSSVAAMVNHSLLAALGIDKTSLIKLGSAFAWSEMFGSPYGIRTGIVSETWFAYGGYYLCILFILGSFIAFAADKIQRARSVVSFIFWSGMFGLLLSSIVGQTTDTTGSTTVFLYVYFLVTLEKYFMRALKRSNHQDFRQSLGCTPNTGSVGLDIEK